MGRPLARAIFMSCGFSAASVIVVSAVQWLCAFGENVDDIKPVIQENSSDSAALDAVFEVLLRAGRSTPMAKALLIPEALSANKLMKDEHRALIQYCNTVMEPWDGPAAIAAYADNWVIAGMDRNGLRPMRYVVTDTGLVIAGSETGMVVVSEDRIVERGRIGPGQMMGIDLARGEMYSNDALKAELAGKRDWGKWTGRAQQMEALLAQNGG